MKYVLTVTRDTERVLERALEFYARALLAQTDYIAETLIESRFDDLPKPGDTKREEAFRILMERRDNAVEYMRSAKQEIWPELARVGHSYGVGHDREADIAWGTYEVLRYTRSWHDHPEGGITVNFDTPMRWADEPLPECRIEGEQSWRDLKVQAIAPTVRYHESGGTGNAAD